MPLSFMDRDQLGFAEIEPKTVNDDPVQPVLPDGRDRSLALIDALSSRDYSGSHRLREKPITDPYANRVH